MTTSNTPSSSAVRALALEYKGIQEEPVEGFRVKLVNDDSLFEWEVAIFGPPTTLYEGGYFKVRTTNNTWKTKQLHCGSKDMNYYSHIHVCQKVALYCENRQG